MTFYQSIKAQLEKHEGRKSRPYKCSKGYLTIGIGRNLETNPLSNEEIDFLFSHDLNEVVRDLESMFGNIFSEFSPARRLALVDMRFNLGYHRFRSFKKMLAAIRERDWDRAAEEALDSKWAQDVQPERVFTVVAQLRRG